ncbi:glucokinase [Pseudokordiimonas caeni]|uniref:glucokinase n=1 Tax=Pseudokordiimonas caeni TaxID=2997908 RepID=UPI00281278B1|nr:glucokinase [Pseudokordiimonas caeni]
MGMKPAPLNRPLVVADIGGTNGRFALASTDTRTGGIRLDGIQRYACREFPSLAVMLGAYLETLGQDDRPSEAHLALAGPVRATGGRITNLDWTIDAESVERDTGLGTVSFLNDFAALAHAVPWLGDSESMVIREGRSEKGAPISVVGPGTGFGVAILMPTNGNWTVVPTEGGHIGFSPSDDREQALVRFLQPDAVHVSVELLMSGRGLTRIYRFLSREATGSVVELSAADISAAAEAGTDPLAVETVRMFLDILARTAGDMALAHGARGGVMIGGGILPKLAHFIDRDRFAKLFSEKGPVTDYLTPIPVRLITTDAAALIGAALASPA